MGTPGTPENSSALRLSQRVRSGHKDGSSRAAQQQQQNLAAADGGMDGMAEHKHEFEFESEGNLLLNI
jgi:hypothetical protein